MGWGRLIFHPKTLKVVWHALLLVLAVYLLWPPAADQAADTSLESVLNREIPSHTRYLIEFAPNNSYMPGTLPATATHKLKGNLEVVEAFEKRFPDTKIRFRQAASRREWVVTQLAGGTAPDILTVNVEDVWQDIHKGWYLALDKYLEQPDPFVEEGAPGSRQWWDLFRYQAISRGKAAPDGKLYNLTYDMVETGMLYNKTLFDLLGVDFPTTWEAMITILERLQSNPFYRLAHELSLQIPTTETELESAGRQFQDSRVRAGFAREGVDFPETLQEWHTFGRFARHKTLIPMLTNGGSIADWGTDLLFDQLYYSLLPAIDLKQDPVREQYLQGYLDWDEICFLNQKGFFTKNDPRYWELFRLLKEWRRFWNKNLAGDRQRGTDLYKEFVNQRGAMLWGGSWHVNRLNNDPELDFQWDVGYLPRMVPPSGVLDMTVREYLQSIIGPTQKPPDLLPEGAWTLSVDDYLRKYSASAYRLPMPRDTALYASDVEMCVIGGAGTQYEVTNTAFNDTGNPKTSQKLKRVIQFLQFITLPENVELVVNENPVLLPNVVGVPLTRGMAPFAKILERRYTTTKWMFTFDNRYNRVYERMLLLYLEDGINLDEFMDWQTKNLAAAVNTIIRRKKLDFSGFEERWQERAAVRQTMHGIPLPPGQPALALK